MHHTLVQANDEGKVVGCEEWARFALHLPLQPRESGLGSGLQDLNRPDGGRRSTNAGCQGQPLSSAYDLRAGAQRSPLAGAIFSMPCIDRKEKKNRVEIVNWGRGNDSLPRLVSATNGNVSPIARTNQRRTCDSAANGDGSSALEEGRESAPGTDSRCPRVGPFRQASGLPSRAMDVPRHVVNFGPGPAKLPLSVSPSERAPRVRSRREYKSGWLCISARVAVHLERWLCISAPCAGIPSPRPSLPNVLHQH